MSTKIKICGITNFEDAACASRLGVEYLGFNFFPGSRRYVSPVRAREIADKLQGKPKIVGVFVNASIFDICEVLLNSRIDLIQLHGDETDEFATEVINQTGLPVIRAIRIRADGESTEIVAPGMGFVLLDSIDKHEFSGIRKPFDWSKAAGMTELKSKLFLAGGLNSHNVANAIETVRPFAVDACSGLEMHDGIKDHQEIKDFVENINRCDASLSAD